MTPTARRRIAASIVLAATAAATVGATAAQSAAAPTTIVSLTFDDNRASQLNALPLLAEHDMAGTFYVNSGRVDRRGFLTRQQLAQMAAAGHEVGSHTPDHTNVSKLTQSEAERIICADVAALRSMGHDPVSFAYPEGVSSPASQQAVAACGLTSGRGVGGLLHPSGCRSCPLAESIPPRNAFHLATPPSVKSTTTLEDLKGYVTRAEQGGGGWVALVLHDVGVSGSLSIPTATLDAFLDWLAPREASGTVVRTVRAVMGSPPPPPPPCEYDPSIPASDPGCVPPPPPPGADLVTNASLEQRTASGPECFTRAGYGTASFTWTGVGEAHTGSWAEQLTITSISSGDRKLVPTMSTACAPAASAGQTLAMSVWYHGSVEVHPVTYYLTPDGTWHYWQTFAAQPASSTWRQAAWVSAPAPSGTMAVSFGLAVKQVGTVTTDDYALSVR